MFGLKDIFQETTSIGNVAYVRFVLLVRQKLGWMSFLVGIGLVVLSLITAQVSYVNPARMFWDFGHAVLFVLGLVLSVYLGSQLFVDEKNRRTLHLVLCGGVSRFAWFVGNTLGIWLAVVAMFAFWFLLISITSIVIFDSYPWTISIQAVLLLVLEIAIVLLMGFLFSLFVRPLLALVGTGVIVGFLHSLTSLQMIFADKQVGAFVSSSGANIFLLLGRFLPPLEWLDIKMLIGFEDSIPLTNFLGLAGSAFIWIVILSIASHLRFRKMDL